MLANPAFWWDALCRELPEIQHFNPCSMIVKKVFWDGFDKESGAWRSLLQKHPGKTWFGEGFTGQCCQKKWLSLNVSVALIPEIRRMSGKEILQGTLGGRWLGKVFLAICKVCYLQFFLQFCVGFCPQGGAGQRLVAPLTGWMLYYLCFTPSTAIGPPLR